MELHESLAQLAHDHGESLFTEADAFRGALDDYLDEGSASTGTINLLTDAVRLGALQAMLTMLDSGASVEDAIETAGQRLSRDRGSADVAGSQWACAVLGYALGKVPVTLATGLRPDAYTAEPPAATAPLPPQARSQPPSQSPGQSPGQPPGQSPAQSPPQQWPTPSAHLPSQHQPPAAPAVSAPAAHPQSATPYAPSVSPYAYTAQPGYGTTPPPKKASSALIIGAMVAIVILGVVAIIGILALTGGDDTPSSDDTTSEPTESNDGSESTSASTSVSADPALTLRGSGYTYQFPSDKWQDLTADTPDSTGTIDTIAAPGDSIATARGNILVETSSAFGTTDVHELAAEWKTTLTGSTGATPVDLGDMQIGGVDAVGVELKWTNDNNFDVHQIAYLVISNDEQYSITGSFRQGDNGFKDTYYSVLDTWVWEG